MHRATLWIGPHGSDTILIGATARGIFTLLPGDDEPTLLDEFKSRFPATEYQVVTKATPHIGAAIKALEGGERPPLDLRGTDFQNLVWEALLAIPRAKTMTYGELARAIGRPQAFRAVAQACGANPIAILVPCHRILGTGGALGGYRWGVERKRRMIADEAASA